LRERPPMRSSFPQILIAIVVTLACAATSALVSVATFELAARERLPGDERIRA
jgi:hypothetical protein